MSGIRIPPRRAPGVRKGKSVARGVRPTWIPIPALPLTSCGALGKRVSFLEPQLPHKKTEARITCCGDSSKATRPALNSPRTPWLSSPWPWKDPCFLFLKHPSEGRDSIQGRCQSCVHIPEEPRFLKRKHCSDKVWTHLLFDPEESTRLQLALAYPCHLPPQNDFLS